MKASSALRVETVSSYLESAEPLIIEEPTLPIRALNSDNHREAEKLVELLTSYFGSGYPFDGVYDPEYWCARLEEDIEGEDSVLSLVAEANGKFLAHVALRSDNLVGKDQRVELFMPAIHSDLRTDLIRISRQFWLRVEQLAARQGWELVYQYSPTFESALQIMSAKCFDSFEMALVPDITSIPEPGTLYRRNALLLLLHHFAVGRREVKYLYVPSKHVGKVRELLSPLKLNRIIVEEGRNDSPEGGESSGITVEIRERVGLRQVRLDPGKIACRATALEAVDEHARAARVSQQRITVEVSMNDPRCPVTCAALEEIGFRFCGIFPLADENDYILYSQFDRAALTDLSLYSPRARSLCDYLLKHR